MTLSVLQIGVYDLYSKTARGIEESLDGFTVTNTSVMVTSAKALILRFRRSYDVTFAPSIQQVLPCSE